mmetsp:Transcript_8718/g.28754  ORF Transcript_8718/g.28754 Transcript_8718/m.28754 type:complete len:353 (-) Transcript_8718:247-1305(-)
MVCRPRAALPREGHRDPLASPPGGVTALERLRHRSCAKPHKTPCGVLQAGGLQSRAARIVAGIRPGRGALQWIGGASSSADPRGAMFSLLYGLWEYLFRKAEFRVLILGIDKACPAHHRAPHRLPALRAPHRFFFRGPRWLHSLRGVTSWHAKGHFAPARDACGARLLTDSAGLAQAGKTTLLEKIKTLYTDLEGMQPDKILPTVGLNIGRVEVLKSNLIFWDLGGQVGLRSIWDKYYEEAHAVLYVVDAAGAGRIDDAREALDRVLQSNELAGAPVLVMANKQDLPGASSRTELQDALELRKYSGRECHVQPVCAFTGEGLEDGLGWLVESMKSCPRTMLLRQKALAPPVQ